ncbi:MAG: hypothetical protein R2706_03295 [Acidimicrobiales bacterium]
MLVSSSIPTALTVVDTGPAPAYGALVRRQIDELIGDLDLPLKRCVITSSRVPFTGGSNGAFGKPPSMAAT